MTIGVIVMRSDLSLESFMLPRARSQKALLGPSSDTLAKQQHSEETQKIQKLESYFCNYYIHQHPPQED